MTIGMGVIRRKSRHIVFPQIAVISFYSPPESPPARCPKDAQKMRLSFYDSGGGICLYEKISTWYNLHMGTDMGQPLNGTSLHTTISDDAISSAGSLKPKIDRSRMLECRNFAACPR